MIIPCSAPWPTGAKDRDLLSPMTVASRGRPRRLTAQVFVKPRGTSPLDVERRPRRGGESGRTRARTLPPTGTRHTTSRGAGPERPVWRDCLCNTGGWVRFYQKSFRTSPAVHKNCDIGAYRSGRLSLRKGADFLLSTTSPGSMSTTSSSSDVDALATTFPVGSTTVAEP